jgi:glycerophosphoryl diester phosphodiesterase
MTRSRLLATALLALTLTGCWRPLVVARQTSEAGERLLSGRPDPRYPKRRPSPFHDATGGGKVIAHRANAMVAPENTLASFQAALDVGADALEFDVRLSKDGVPVIMHDKRVDRTTNGHGLVSQLTYAQLRKLDAGSHKGPQFKGEVVPTLDELLALARGKALLLCELKSPDLRLPRLVADALDKHQMAERTLVISFHPASLLAMKRLRPEQPIGLLAYPYDPPGRRALSAKADAVLGFFGSLDRSAIRGAHRAGLEVLTWTVNDRAEMANMVAQGVDGLITDDPVTAREVVALAAGRRLHPKP